MTRSEKKRFKEYCKSLSYNKMSSVESNMFDKVFIIKVVNIPYDSIEHFSPYLIYI